jgi:hypothetical protein
MSRTRLILPVIGIAMLTAIGLPRPASASAPAVTAGHYSAGRSNLSLTGSQNALVPAAWTGEIRDSQSGLCLGIAANGYAGQWSCNPGQPDQTWHPGSYDPWGHGYLSLINGNGKCLGTRSGDTADGTPVVAWVAAPCQNHPDQYWSGDPNTGLIRNLANPGEYLSVSDTFVSGSPVFICQQICGDYQIWFWPR